MEFRSMKAKISAQLVLTFGLVLGCGDVLAAQGAVIGGGNLGTELAWLIGAGLLGFSVVMRRSPAPPSDTGQGRTTEVPDSKPAPWVFSQNP